MKQGPLLKWIEEIKATDRKYDPSQMSFSGPSGLYGDAFGVLMDSISKEEWEDCWDDISHGWNGMVFTPSQEFCKRNKIKNDPWELNHKFDRLGSWVKIERFLRLFGKDV